MQVLLTNPFVRTFAMKVVQVVAFEVARSACYAAKPLISATATSVHNYVTNRNNKERIYVKL
jgi:hypothetical protein